MRTTFAAPCKGHVWVFFTTSVRAIWFGQVSGSIPPLLFKAYLIPRTGQLGCRISQKKFTTSTLFRQGFVKSAQEIGNTWLVAQCQEQFVGRNNRCVETRIVSWFLTVPAGETEPRLPMMHYGLRGDTGKAISGLPRRRARTPRLPGEGAGPVVLQGARQQMGSVDSPRPEVR